MSIRPTYASQRDEEALVLWSQDARSIVQDYQAINHALLHYTSACVCKEYDPSGIVMVASDANQNMGDNSFDFFSFCSGGDYYTGNEPPYTPEHGLKSLPELVHLNGLQRGQQATMSNDRLGLFGDRRLSVSNVSMLDASLETVSNQASGRAATLIPPLDAQRQPHIISPLQLGVFALPKYAVDASDRDRPSDYMSGRYLPSGPPLLHSRCRVRIFVLRSPHPRPYSLSITRVRDERHGLAGNRHRSAGRAVAAGAPC